MNDIIVDYDNVRPKLQNGDICLFRGKGIMSRAILWFCSIFSRFKPITFSHIGFIVIDKDRVMLCESTTLRYKNTADISYTKRGVRLVPLSQLVIMYPGEICIRQLTCVRTDKMLLDLGLFVAHNLNKPYEQHLTELMGSAMNNNWYKGNDDDSLFCSELVAGLYKQWGLLPANVPADHYSPEDFTDNGVVDNAMFTAGSGAELEPRIRIK